MIGLIQLVSSASVTISDQITASIGLGIVALIGIEKTDSVEQGKKLIEKILNFRIFKDSAGKMNLNLKDIQGELLLVPQFTLVADTSSGTRPGFSKGMSPNEGQVLFQQLIIETKNLYLQVQSGQFGAYMQVNLCNDGPVTFILQT